MKAPLAGIFALITVISSTATSVAALHDTPDNLPDQVAPGKQSGSNQCRRKWGATHSDANCQNLYVNGADDFCLFSSPYVANVEDVEPDVVSYCLRKGYGTRLIPHGTIHGLQFIKTPSYGQLTLVGDFTKINVKPKDEGSELDNAGPDGESTP